MNPDAQIVITGGAGLVGQNLVVVLRERGYRRLRVLDKSAANLAVLAGLHPEVETCEADLAAGEGWQHWLDDADVVVALHAQIGGLFESEFYRNNVLATEQLLDALRRRPDCYLLHVSSSVLESQADDFYTRSKGEQEVLVTRSGFDWCVLRPTLMFGWFDRKHLGWLSRFMQRVPVFPIPGRGRFLRQPLYVGDFCEVLLACMEKRITGEYINVSGREKVTYMDLMRMVRATVDSHCLLLPIPIWLFALLLRVYALVDRNPPFTAQQLKALVIDETFPEDDWEQAFDIRATPLEEAVERTFRDPRYSGVELAF